MKSQQSKSVIEEQAQCNKDEAIPLYYESIDSLEQCKVLEMAYGESSESWHRASKGLMLRKAALAFIALCKLNMDRNMYMSALHNIRSGLYCYSKYSIIILLKLNRYNINVTVSTVLVLQ